MWEQDVDINQIYEIRSKTNVFFGVGAIEKFEFILSELAKKNIDRVICVTGKASYKVSTTWDHIIKAFDKANFNYILYDEVSPNPTVDHVDDATQKGRHFGAQAVIAIGGGSAIDVGKSVAVLLKNTEFNARELYQQKSMVESALPLIAVNLTHGTGTEANRYAVVSTPEKQYKSSIVGDCIYPMYSIIDPSLMTKLSSEQTLFVSLDALNHAIEAATATSANPYSIFFAKESIRLIEKYLPISLSEPINLEARYYLSFASMLGGIAIDNGILHLTHALEHPLSAVNPSLSHGHGLAMILPQILKIIYPAKSKILADILKPIIPGLNGTSDEATFVCDKLINWLSELGINQSLKDLGFTESDSDLLTELVYTTPGLINLVNLTPIDISREDIKAIYLNAILN